MSKVNFPIISDFESKLPYYFGGVGCDYTQEDINRPLGYPEYQWIQCNKGKGILWLNGTKYIIEKGMGMLFFPNEPHRYESASDRWLVDWVIFKGKEIGNFIHTMLGLNHSEVMYITNPHIVRHKIEALYSKAISHTPEKNLSCSVLVYEILTDLVALTSHTQKMDMYSQFDKITPVLKYINGQYNKQLTLQELSEVAGVTPQHLCGIFKKYTSHTVFEYINLERIQRAKEMLLRDKNMQIKEIAHTVGFTDVSYFCSVFRRIENMSPTEFRRL